MKEQKLTVYWETKIEHKRVIRGTQEQLNNIIEALDDPTSQEDTLRDLECDIISEQGHTSELDFYDLENVEDIEVDWLT